MPSFEIDMTEDTFATADAGSIVPDWYKCVLEDVYIDDKSGQCIFKWDIIDGPYKGGKITDRLSNPELMEGNAIAVSKKRHKLYAARLGLSSPENDGKAFTIDYADALGKKCLIQLHARGYNDPKTGAPRSTTEPTFDGIFPLEPVPHDKIPLDVRKRFGIPLTKEQEDQLAKAAAPVKGGKGGGGKKAPTTANGTAGESKPPIDTSDL